MEGLRLWTMITGTITSTAKYIVQAFAEDCFHKGDRERILGFLVAFAVTLKRELRDEKDLRELKSVLSDEDLARLQNSSGMSSYCLYVLSGYLLEAKQRETQLPQTFIVVRLLAWAFVCRALCWEEMRCIVRRTYRRQLFFLLLACALRDDEWSGFSCFSIFLGNGFVDACISIASYPMDRGPCRGGR